MLDDFNHCCGCRACEYVCPTSAISFHLHDDSFLYPQIDESKCIQCHRCERICDWNKEKESNGNIRAAYGFQHQELSVIKSSTSGGAFTAISDYVLGNGGVVFGAVMHDDLMVYHEIAFTADERNRMRGSKYVQCDMRDVYQKIRQRLDENRLVLFTGTPCQAAAVRTVFGKKYLNLIIVDFLCHGVNSNQMLLEHVAWLEKRYNRKITSYEFRPKDLTWAAAAAAAVQFENERRKRFLPEVQTFYRLFTSNTSLRESCYHCKYRTQHRYADITIADFWGYEKFYPKKDKKGLSLLFVTSECGDRIIEHMQQQGEILEIPFVEVQHRIALHPPEKSNIYNKFEADYEAIGYEKTITKYFPISIKTRIRFFAKKIIRGIEAKKNKLV